MLWSQRGRGCCRQTLHQTFPSAHLGGLQRQWDWGTGLHLPPIQSLRASWPQLWNLFPHFCIIWQLQNLDPGPKAPAPAPSSCLTLRPEDFQTCPVLSLLHFPGCLPSAALLFSPWDPVLPVMCTPSHRLPSCRGCLVESGTQQNEVQG